MPGKCIYQEVWNDIPEYLNWIAPVKNDKHKAFCRICKKEFDLVRMGESALKMHAKGKRHAMLLNTSAGNTIKEFFCANSSPLENVLDEKKQTISKSLDDYVTRNEILDAEIKWAMKCALSNYSFNSCGNIGAYFLNMFSDSKIAKQFTCSSTKCSYLLCFGIAPYFKSLLLDNLHSTPFYVLSFDETLNMSLQEKQMDIYVRFWNEESNKVEMKFLTSVFIGHSTADILLNSFLEAIKNLMLNKVLQISMDGPAVNLKFFKLLQTEIKTSHNCELLNIGTCSLHTLNNSFKHGEKASGWDLDNLLCCLYYLFKDSPARREYFLYHSESKKLPKAFCRHRWLENVECAQRALIIWGDVKKYVQLVESGKLSKPTSKSFSTVQIYSKDSLVPIKLNFFLSVAKLIQPFMVIFQNDKPLLPFLASELTKIITNSLSYFCVMKKECIAQLTSSLKVSNFDFTDKKCYSSVSEISAGFAGDRLIKELKFKKDINDKHLINLKLQCQQFIFTMIIKLIDKSPIQYSFVRSMVCFDPKHMVLASCDSSKKMKHILRLLVEANHVDERDCEEIILQFNNFLSTIVLEKSTEFLDFDFSQKEARLDTFLGNYFSEQRHKKVWHIIKNLLILSHGQADIERGFSINRSLETENLKHETYIAQRIVIDSLKDQDVPTMKIHKKLRAAAFGARQKYLSYLSEKKVEKKNEDSEKKRKVLSDEVDMLNSKKIKLAYSINDLETAADELAVKAEKTRDIKFICQSNSFRRTIKEKKVDLENMESEIKEKLLQLKK